MKIYQISKQIWQFRKKGPIYKIGGVKVMLDIVDMANNSGTKINILEKPPFSRTFMEVQFHKMSNTLCSCPLKESIPFFNFQVYRSAYPYDNYDGTHCCKKIS